MTSYTPPRAGGRALADELAAMVGAPTAYTPVWTASGTAPVLGNGTLTGQYVAVGALRMVSLKLVAGSTTTFGSGNYAFSLPDTCGPQDWIGNLFIGDSSGGGSAYTASALAYIPAGGSTVMGYTGGQGSSSGLSATSPQTFASGDRIWISALYTTQ